MPTPLQLVKATGETRPRPPSRARWAAAHPTIGVSVTREQRDALAARAQALGTTMGTILLGDLADRDHALATAREHGRAEGTASARREGAAALGTLRDEHARALAAAADTAYRRGLAEAAPEWRAAAQRAEATVAQWKAAADALWKWRAAVDAMVDQALDYLGIHEREARAAAKHREYVEAVQKLRSAIDRCLEADLQAVAAKGG